MLLCQIELLAPVFTNTSSGPKYLIVATHNYDVGLQVGDRLQIHQQVDGVMYDLTVMVTHRLYESATAENTFSKFLSDKQRCLLNQLYPNADSRLQQGESIFRVRLLVEAEDRDSIVKISETIRKLNGLD